MEPKIVVLTGGPCAGKSTIMERLKATYDGRATFVPEVATLLLADGFPPPPEPWTPMWQIDFQRAILDKQLETETCYIAEAKEQGHRLVICDRGILDGAAYMPHEIFHHMLQSRGTCWNEVHSHYSTVIHLESRAVSRPAEYGNSSNPFRRENAQQARILDQLTWHAWQQHPLLFRIDSTYDLEWKGNLTEFLIDPLLED